MEPRPGTAIIRLINNFYINVTLDLQTPPKLEVLGFMMKGSVPKQAIQIESYKLIM